MNTYIILVLLQTETLLSCFHCLTVGIVLLSSAFGFLHVLMGNVAKWFSLCLIRPEDLFFVVWKSFRCLLGNSQQTVNCLLVRKGFRMAISTIKRGVEECCTLALSISKRRNFLQTSSI